MNSVSHEEALEGSPVLSSDIIGHGGERAMLLDHVGIVNGDEDRAVRFYGDILGLQKVKESSVMPELARRLFSTDRDIKMLVYGNENLKIEIFIVADFRRPAPPVAHFCIQVPDPAVLVEKARKQGAKVVSAERDGRAIYFVEDFSGNRIELKPHAS